MIEQTILEETELLVRVEDGRVGLLEVPDKGHIEYYVFSEGYEIDFLTDEIPEDGVYTAHCRYIRTDEFDFIGAYNFTPLPDLVFDNKGNLQGVVMHTVHLNAGDSLVFAEGMLNPPEPNEKLKAAKKRYDELVGE